MANKRMFSKDITSSDAFLDMPVSTQAFYFHLGMEADDDGFIGNPRRVMRNVGVSDDDLKILLAKRFLLQFPSGVVVVKHHRINNKWDSYNCKRTLYLEELSQLNIKENKAYTLDKQQGVPVQTENRLKTVSRIEENRIDTSEPEVRVESFIPGGEEPRARSKPKYPHAKEVFAWFPSPEKNWVINTTELKHAELLYERGEERVKKALAFVKRHKDDDYFPKITKPSDLERKWNDLAAFKV